MFEVWSTHLRFSLSACGRRKTTKTCRNRRLVDDVVVDERRTVAAGEVPSQVRDRLEKVGWTGRFERLNRLLALTRADKLAPLQWFLARRLYLTANRVPARGNEGLASTAL